MLKSALAVAALVLFASLPAQAATYQVDPAISRIDFSGTHAGNEFTGSFQRYVVDIEFDPAKPDDTEIRVTIDLASAKTGNKMFDGTLPNDDWFDTKSHPSALFKSTKIEKQADGTYFATGDLTLRGIAKPVTFSFTLDREDAPQINASGTLTVDRLAYDIGKKSDGNAEWVSKDIAITLKMVAKKI